MSDETIIQKNIQKKASKLGLRLFRNNRGLFKTLDGKRKVRAGLEATGASDLVGIKTVTITPEMVGQDVGIFVAVEVKKFTWKKPTTKTEEEQENFIEQINKRGGIAFFCNDENKLESLIKTLDKKS
jgi:hypothetical protein